jgi:hypothetical protein
LREQQLGILVAVPLERVGPSQRKLPSVDQRLVSRFANEHPATAEGRYRQNREDRSQRCGAEEHPRDPPQKRCPKETYSSMRLDPTGLGSKGLRRYKAFGIPDSIGSPQGDSGPPGPVDEVRLRLPRLPDRSAPCRSTGPRFKTLARVNTRSKVSRTTYLWQKNKGKHRVTEITE